MRIGIYLLALAALVACSKKSSSDGHLELGEVSDKLVEASGLVASVANPGHLWTINDSGNPAEVFLIDTTANTKMICKLLGVENRDWEDVAIGSGPDSLRKYVYVAEIGDNKAVYPFKYIYRFPEPSLKEGKEMVIENAEKFVIELPDGKRDSETILIDPQTSDLYLVSKREEKVNLYLSRYPFVSDTLRPEKVLTIPLTQIVAGSISPDGQEVLLKNYDSIYYWKRTNGQSIVELLSQKPTNLSYDPEHQGEALSWNTQATGFFTLSESPEKGARSQLRFYKRK
jgi:hypothetical protein